MPRELVLVVPNVPTREQWSDVAEAHLTDGRLLSFVDGSCRLYDQGREVLTWWPERPVESDRIAREELGELWIPFHAWIDACAPNENDELGREIASRVAEISGGYVVERK